MNKTSQLLVALCVFVLLGIGMTASAAAPSDALYYADFNKGPMAPPEQSMQATDKGGTLYINDGPIDAEASIVDGAMKLALGPNGYYGMGNGDIQFRGADGKLTDYKYLVVRMKGEHGGENVVGNGAPMMVIGGGDGMHISTFNSEAAGIARPFLDPDGKTMPRITTEYQDFVIALTEENVRVNPGKVVSGLNFNNAATNITLYIDEIYLTSTVPEGYKNDGAVAVTTTTAAPQTTANADQGNTTAPQNTVSDPITASKDSTINIILITLVSIALLLNIVVFIFLVIKISKLKD